MGLQFIFPPVEENGLFPQWTGNSFLIGEEQVNVLKYSSSTVGWTDDLTTFHEHTLGEEEHPIDKASRQYGLKHLENYLKSSSPVILEIGCSSGKMLPAMKEHFPDSFIVGSDAVPKYLEVLAPKLKIPLLQFDLLNCPLYDASVDAVVMLNVLEHIENDKVALQQIHRILKPGGVLILEVPAGSNLYDVYDKFLLHYRRYDLTELQSLFIQTGFKIARESHLGFLLYPFFWLVKKRNQRLLKTDNLKNCEKIVEKNIQQTKSNLLLKWVMDLEVNLGYHLTYPIGIRCLVCAIKV